MDVLRERHRGAEDDDDGGRQGASWLFEGLVASCRHSAPSPTANIGPWAWSSQCPNIRFMMCPRYRLSLCSRLQLVRCTLYPHPIGIAGVKLGQGPRGLNAVRVLLKVRRAFAHQGSGRYRRMMNGSGIYRCMHGDMYRYSKIHNKQPGKMRIIHMKSFGSLPKSSNTSSYMFVSALERPT